MGGSVTVGLVVAEVKGKAVTEALVIAEIVTEALVVAERHW